MSNNEELIIRFRQMIEKKKTEEKSKSQETFFSGRNSQTKTTSDNDKNITIDASDGIIEKNNSFKNEYEGKSNIFMDRLRKMRNEIFEDVSESSNITNDNNFNKQKINKEIDDNQEIKNTNKPRPSVFDLARRFEKNEKKQKANSPDNTGSKLKENKNNFTQKENENIIVKSLIQNEETSDANNKISTMDVAILNHEEYDDEIKKYERTSNSRNMMLNSLNKIRDETQQRNSITLKATNNSQTININSSRLNSSEIKENIITDIPKRLVKDLIKMNEKRIRSSSENKNSKRRNTVSQRFQNNMREIRSFIESLKEEQGDSTNKDLNYSEYMERNQETLKKLGIDGKDTTVVQELIEFYENNALYSLKEIEDDIELKKRRQRNTVSNIGKTRTIVVDVDPISEEKDEEASLAESWRKSNSHRLSDRGNINNETNRSKSMQDKLLNESVDSNDILADDKFLNINIAEDEELKENISLKDIINSKLIDSDINKSTILPNSSDKLCDNLIEIRNPSIVFDNNIIHIKPVMNFSYPQPIKTFNNLSITKSNTSDVIIKKHNKDYYKVNEISFFLISDPKYNKFNYEPLLPEKQNQLLIKSITKALNLRINREYAISYINNDKVDKLSVQKINNIELKPQITPTREKKLIIQTYNVSESTADNQISLLNSQTIEFENNKELINFASKSKDNATYNINSINNPSRAAPLSDNPNNHFVKIIEDYQSNTNNSNKYHKNIINSLDSISILQYKLDSRISFDPTFFDVLCTNCYECVRYEDIDLHSDRCVIQLEENFQDLLDYNDPDEDYNSRIYKLHESLKNRHEEIYSTGNACLISIYEEFCRLTYEILLNNNSIEELDISISMLNDLLYNKLCKIKSKFNFSLLVIGQRISQLVFIKLQDMEKILLCVKQNLESDDLLNRNYNNYNPHHDSDEEVDPENLNEIETLKKELVNLERQTIDTRMEIEEWRKESKKLEDMLRRPIQNMEVLSDIVSDVVSKKEESFDEMTMITVQTTERDGNDVGNMRDFNEVLDVHNEEDLKKYFLSIGLSLKFKFGDKIKANSSIGDLYEKAKESNIPISQWYNFIYDELVI